MDFNNDLPAHDIDAECSLIGSIVTQNSLFDQMRVQPDDFYSKRHGNAFKTILNMLSRKDPVDVVTFCHQTKKDFPDGGSLTEMDMLKILDNSPLFKINQYMDIIKECSITRQIKKVCSEILHSDKLGNDILSDAQKGVLAITGSGHEDDIRNVRDIIQEHMERIDAANTTQVENFLRFGFPGLDKRLKTKGPKLIVVAGRPGAGKCLGLDTPVIMYDGSVKMVQDVVPGDKLMGPDSMPKTVQSTAKGYDDLYLVDQKKGDNYIVNKDHILSLKISGKHNVYGFRGGSTINISIDEYLASNKKFKEKAKGWKTGVVFDEKNSVFEIPPYELGLWLGDGNHSSNHGGITTPDEEIKNAWVEYGKSIGLGIRKQDSNGTRCPTYFLTSGRTGGKPNAFLEKIRKLGLDKCLFIPQKYKTAPALDRVDLLAGIIDTDGHLDKNSYEIIQKSKQLAEDITFIARSLGFFVSLNESFKKAQGWTEKKKYYRILISGQTCEIPCKLGRKVARERRQIKDVLVTGVNVSPIGKGDYYGFELDGDGLFLLGDFTVTHNTSFALTAIKNLDRAGVHAGLISIEMPEFEMIDRLLSMESTVTASKFGQYKGLNMQEYQMVNDAAGVYYNSNIQIDSMGGVDISDVERKGRRMKNKGAEILFIDQLSQIGNREVNSSDLTTRYSENTTRLSSLKKELGIPIVLLAQLNRDLKARSNKRPILSDLKQSGKIEEDADAVIFIHRPEEYADSEEEKEGLKGMAIIDLAKNRSGAKYTDKNIMFHHETTYFHQGVGVGQNY